MTYNELVEHTNNGRIVCWRDDSNVVIKLETPVYSDYAIKMSCGGLSYIVYRYAGEEDFYVYNLKAE